MYALLVLAIICCIVTINSIDCSQDVAVHNATTAKMGILIGSIGHNKTITDMVDVLQRDMQASDQFYTKKHIFNTAPKNAQEITTFFPQGYHFVLIINNGRQKHTLEYRLYDATTGSMITQASGAYQKKGKSIQGWAHHIADKMWPIITGEQSMFSSKIAYCKQASHESGVPVKYICVSDHDGSHEQVIVQVPTVNVAPRWNNDAHNPLILYSEYTNTNVRLVAVNTHKKRKVVSDFDGINMQPEFSADGSMVVYCASHGDGCCHIYQFTKNGLVPLIVNDGNNVSPTLADDGHVMYFCSDFQTGSPQIYVYYTDTKMVQRITNGGYCASPAYCQKRKQLVYAKMMNGQMQLFLYDEDSKKHTQLTWSVGNKEECCWSPCGNYIAYAYTQGRNSRIAILNLITKQERFITPVTACCSYPAWSVCYETFPVFS